VTEIEEEEPGAAAGGELTTALTFARAALQAKNDTKRRRRNQANARKAYDTIMSLGKHLSLSDASGEDHAVEKDLDELKAALKQVGESL
jgi:hypothetical protein